MSVTIDPDSQIATNRNGKAIIRSEHKLSGQIDRRNFWRSGAPKGAAQGGTVWSDYLAQRRVPDSVDRLLDAKGTALAWGVNLASLPSSSFELLQLAAQANRGKLPHPVAVTDVFAQWLTHSSAPTQSSEFALECLAVANLLPRVAGAIDSELWWQLLDLLADVVDQVQQWQVNSETHPGKALAHQLMAGELPLTLAYLFPEIRPLYKLRTAAQDTLAEGLLEFMNGAGLPKASLLAVSRPLLACWTRSRAMGASWQRGFWGAKAEEQYRFAVGKSIALSSSTGCLLLSEPGEPTWSRDFLAAVLRLGGGAADRTAAELLFDKKLTKLVSGKRAKHIDEFSESCEWSGLALMRTGLGRKETVVAIDFSEPAMRFDIWRGDQRLFIGQCDAETTIDGVPIDAVGSWEETCWFSDDDADYIELSLELSQGIRLERQVMLAREDGFLLLVDNVMNLPGDVVRHQVVLPLGPGVGFVPEAETRDGVLIGDQPLARVLPLALPEWRVDPRIGELSAVDGRLQLVEERRAKNLSCPLFIDLSTKRLTKPCTWRQLTVAQTLEIQSPDVAVGYRVQCGKKQWLVYRSQGPVANRTVLGYNLSIEGMIGRFIAPEGEVQELVQVEG